MSSRELVRNNNELIRNDKTDLILGRALKSWVGQSILPESQRGELIQAAKNSLHIQQRWMMAGSLIDILDKGRAGLFVTVSNQNPIPAHLKEILLGNLRKLLKRFDSFLIIGFPYQPIAPKHEYQGAHRITSQISMMLSDHAAAYSLMTGYGVVAAV